VGRPRSENKHLPKGVYPVTNRHGQTYYYFQHARGTKHAGPRVELGKDTSDPEFWRKLRDAKGAPVGRVGTWSALIADWRAQNWERLRPATRKETGYYLKRLDVAAGDRSVASLTKRDIYHMLDGMSATPYSANQMLSVLRNVLEWSVPRGYREDNPAVGIKRLKVDESGHEPWSAPGWDFVMANAPTHLYRMAYIGRATGQRVSDLVKMRPADLAIDGIYVKIGKLRDKKHFVPLTTDQMAKIKCWGVKDLDYFITTPITGKRCTPKYLNQLWSEWRASPGATPIRGLRLTIHGLRATKIEDLRLAGCSDGQIADEVGISEAMVRRYLRFANKAALARASRDRREQKQPNLQTLWSICKPGAPNVLKLPNFQKSSLLRNSSVASD
jgi:integrase